MPESGLARLWNSIKPPSPVLAPGEARRKLNPKQKRLIFSAASFFFLAGVGSAAYVYISGAPQRAEAEYQAGMKWMRPGHYQEAVAQFTRSIQIHELAAAYLERGFANRFLGHADQAAADLEKAAQMDPGSARAYSGLGSLYRDRGESQRAIEQYTKSIQISPNVDAFFERGQLYEALGEHQKAIDDFTQAIDRIRDAPYIYRARAMAESNLGNTGGAEADRKYALSIEGSH